MLSKEKIEEIILSAGLAVELESPIPADKAFAELELDSLDIYNIFVELEVHTSHMVPDEEIQNLQTIADIHTYFAKLDS